MAPHARTASIVTLRGHDDLVAAELSAHFVLVPDVVGDPCLHGLAALVGCLVEDLLRRGLLGVAIEEDALVAKRRKLEALYSR